jgi:hypothetical protein
MGCGWTPPTGQEPSKRCYHSIARPSFWQRKLGRLLRGEDKGATRKQARVTIKQVFPAHYYWVAWNQPGCPPAPYPPLPCGDRGVWLRTVVMGGLSRINPPALASQSGATPPLARSFLQGRKSVKPAGVGQHLGAYYAHFRQLPAPAFSWPFFPHTWRHRPRPAFPSERYVFSDHSGRSRR